MGGKDLHDQRCNKIEPVVRSKKWTWIIFIRLIQTPLTNATILRNICDQTKTKKVNTSTKNLVINEGKEYLRKSKKLGLSKHEIEKIQYERYCCTPNCKIRTRKFCKTCSLYYSDKCYKKMIIELNDKLSKD